MDEINGPVDGKTIPKLLRTSTTTCSARDVEGVRRADELPGPWIWP